MNSLSDPREFLKLPKAQRREILAQQAQEVAHLYQPGSDVLEWTESYAEDKAPVKLEPIY